MHPTVLAAIAQQYEAFKAPAPQSIEGCPCCSDPAELAEIVRTPRRALTAAQLESYASSALLTIGDVSDLRHYWPRLAELSLSGDLLTDAEIVFAKPRHGNWHEWPAVERDALTALAHAQLFALASEGVQLDRSDIETWVCAFAQFLDDVTSILHPLLLPEPGPASALRGWYRLNEDWLPRGQLWDAFWDSAPGNAARVCEWFGSPPVRDALDRAFTLPVATD
jgi:hypothetical protein